MGPEERRGSLTGELGRGPVTVVVEGDRNREKGPSVRRPQNGESRGNPFLNVQLGHSEGSVGDKTTIVL